MKTKLNPIEWTPWSKPCILKEYKYKDYIIQKINQVSISKFSVHHRTRFRGTKNGETVTNEYLKYSDCINEIKRIIDRNKKGNMSKVKRYNIIFEKEG